MTQLKDRANRLSLKDLLAEDQDLMRHLVKEAMEKILAEIHRPMSPHPRRT